MPQPCAGTTQTRPGQRCWFSRKSESLADLAVLFTCTSTSMHLGGCMSYQAQDVHLEHLSLPAKLCLFSVSVSGSMSPLCCSNAISYINHPPLRNYNPAYLQIRLFIEINKGENTWH